MTASTKQDTLDSTTGQRRPGSMKNLLRSRWIWSTAAIWLAMNAWVLAQPSLPFPWPNRSTDSIPGQLVDANLALVQVLLLMALTYGLTRKRVKPDLLARAPRTRVALRETLLLLAYGGAGLWGGYALARSFGWHPFGLHLAGTLHATHGHVSVAEAIVWAGYNLAVYAIVPLAYFSRRYSLRDLNLRSVDRRNDLRLIVVVLAVEAAIQVLALRPDMGDLTGQQVVAGFVVTFVLYMSGAVLPAMVFIYAILVPRFLRLTGSAPATVILGGLTYAALHVWDSWTLFDSPTSGGLSLVFLLFTYFGPGMIKTYLTLRTGNAWVHVWAYHAFAPHALVDTPHTIEIFQIGGHAS